MRLSKMHIKTLREVTQIDRWFLYQIQDIVKVEQKLKEIAQLNKVDAEMMMLAKKMGFSDEQIAAALKDCTPDDVYDYRKSLGVTRVFKMVDTCSAEFEAKTPYFYSTFETKATQI